MPCNVCKHNQVKDIDRGLLTGVSLASLSKTYGFSPEALQLHHQHLKKKMVLAQQRFHDGLHQGLLCKLSIVMELVLGVVRGARAGEDFKLFLQASREFTRIVSLMLKMDARLEPEMIYCLMASPQWDLQEGVLLPNSIPALNATRQSLKVNLFAPCPEPAPEPEPDAVQTPTVEMCKLQLETLTAATSPKSQREISAKLARNIAFNGDINVKNQYDSLNEKIFPPNPQNPWQHGVQKREKSGKSAGKTTLKEGNI
jgi:hypothetical protein